MIVASKDKQAEIIAFIPSIKANMSEWQIVSVKIPQRGKKFQNEVMQTLKNVYKDREGMLISVGDYKIVMVVRLGIINNYALLKSEIESQMPKFDARIIARKMNIAGMKQIQLDLSDRDRDGKITLYEERENRNKNIFLLAEDDAFVRKTLSNTLQNHGEVHEVSDGAQVATEYMKCNPDIVLLDIHLPNKNGLTLVDELMEIDTDAFIVLASSDSGRDNVIEAMSGGAAGFLAKPVKRERMVDYLTQCITFKI